MREIFGEAWPDWPANDFALIAQPIDFLGVNYYTRNVTRFDASAWPLRAAPVRQPRATYTETGLGGLCARVDRHARQVKQRYGNLPLYVTENGAAFFDPPTAESERVHDPLRVDYLRKHLRAVQAAIQQRRGRARLFRLVTLRQSRVVAGLLEALRDCARRLRHPAAHAQGQRGYSIPASSRRMARHSTRSLPSVAAPSDAFRLSHQSMVWPERGGVGQRLAPALGVRRRIEIPLAKTLFERTSDFRLSYTRISRSLIVLRTDAQNTSSKRVRGGKWLAKGFDSRGGHESKGARAR